MGIFDILKKKKSEPVKEKKLYQYEILEQYKGNLDGCELVGETTEYLIFTIGGKSYLLRQEKTNPNMVVFLGRAYDHNCIYKDMVFSIQSISYIGDSTLPLFCTDVNTGNRTQLHILSNKAWKCFIGDSIHCHCQDSVNSICVDNGTLLIDVTRHEEDFSSRTSSYQGHLSYDGESFKIEYTHPETQKTTTSVTSPSRRQKNAKSSVEEARAGQFDDLFDAWLASTNKTTNSRVPLPNEKNISPRESTINQNQSIPNQLREYKALFDEGIITEDEFRRKKEQLLDL